MVSRAHTEIYSAGFVSNSYLTPFVDLIYYPNSFSSILRNLLVVFGKHVNRRLIAAIVRSDMVM